MGAAVVGTRRGFRVKLRGLAALQAAGLWVGARVRIWAGNEFWAELHPEGGFVVVDLIDEFDTTRGNALVGVELLVRRSPLEV